MGSAGQAGGAVAGGIIGAIIASIPTLGLGAVQGFALGAAIGGAIGGLIDPPKTEQPEAKHELQEVQYNTFSHDTPVPILLGKARWYGNIIYIGNTYGQVESTGQQQGAGGKGVEPVDVTEVVYYADFVMGICEGPIQTIEQVLREDEDISDREGSLYTKSFGSPDETTIPTIVTGAPTPITRPVPWRHTAKLIYSGRLGNVNRLPRLGVVAVGPSTLVEESGDVSLGIGAPSTIAYDDVSGYLYGKTDAHVVSYFQRDGTALNSNVTPNEATMVVDQVAFNGRSGDVLIFCTIVGSDRIILQGEIGWDDSADWEQYGSSAEGMYYGIDAMAIDDGAGYVYTAHDYGTDLSVVRTTFGTVEQEEYLLEVPDAASATIRGLYFDKVNHLLYLLYENGADLFIRRFDPRDVRDTMDVMEVSYGHTTPTYVFVTGDLIGIVDTGTAQALHYVEWGGFGEVDSYGSASTAGTFEPKQIAGIEFHLDAGGDEMTTSGAYADTDPVGVWYDETGLGRNFSHANSARHPTFRTNRVNSLPALEFDGTNDNLDCGLQANGVQVEVDRDDCTTFVVFKPTNANHDNRDCVLSAWQRYGPGGYAQDPDDRSTRHFVWGGPPNGDADSAWNWESGGVVSTWGETWDAWLIRCADSKPGQINVRDEEDNILATGAHTQGGLVDDWFSIGRSIADQNEHFTGEIAEIIVYDRALEDDERQQVLDYLREKYQINPPASATFGAGTRLVYTAPIAFFFADQLAHLFVLDDETTAGGSWAVKWSHWNGDNWSRLTPSAYAHRFFEEVSSAAGGAWSLFVQARRGIGMPTTFLDRTSFERVSGFCNSPVDMAPYAGYPVEYAARLQLDYLLATKRQLTEVLREILISVNCFMVYSEGKLKLHVDRDNGIIENYFGDGSEGSVDNIVLGSFNYDEIPRDEVKNHIIVEFIDATNDFRKTPFPDYADWEVDLHGEYRRETINALGCSRPRQAAIIARTKLLSMTMRRWTCNFQTTTHALKNEVGDVVAITHADPGWVEKRFLIAQMIESQDDTITLVCVEHVDKIGTARTYPMQEPARLQQLANPNVTGTDPAAAVLPPTRTEVIEDVDTGRLFLFASKPPGAGPWASVRWYASWDSAATPMATVYPGATPFTDDYTLTLATTVFTASGVLKNTITASDTMLELIALSADIPPTFNFVAYIVDPGITPAQFGLPSAPAGSGPFYERIQASVFNDLTGEMTISQRGSGTNALAHTVREIDIDALFVYDDNAPLSSRMTPWWFRTWPSGSPYFGVPPSPPVVTSTDPLRSVNDEIHIGFNETDFDTDGPPNSIRFTVTQYSQSGSSVGSHDPDDPAEDLLPIYEYSSGDGEWTELTGVEDSTGGFRVSGAISFDIPTDWVTATQWSTAYGGNVADYPADNTARYYIRIRRTAAGSGGILSNNPPRQRIIEIEDQDVDDPRGYIGPLVYMLTPGASPAVYDFGPQEQGYTLRFKCQPVGFRGQTVPLDDIEEVSHEIGNIAGEGL